MNRMRLPRSKYLAMLVVPLAIVMLTGCPFIITTGAVLAGTWAVQAENAPDLNQLLLTFDANGNLTSITYQIGENAAVSATPVATTSVSGSLVSITAVFPINNSVNFSGTLNAENTVITGTLSTNITVGGLTVTLSNGPATLTKQ